MDEKSCEIIYVKNSIDPDGPKIFCGNMNCRKCNFGILNSSSEFFEKREKSNSEICREFIKPKEVDKNQKVKFNFAKLLFYFFRMFFGVVCIGAVIAVYYGLKDKQQLREVERQLTEDNRQLREDKQLISALKKAKEAGEAIKRKKEKEKQLEFKSVTSITTETKPSEKASITGAVSRTFGGFFIRALKHL